MTSFDTNAQIEEFIPLCPFCEEPLSGKTINGLHAACDEEFAEELEEAYESEFEYEEEYEPNEGHIEYAMQAYYGFGSR
jgi:hypothetical protein